MIKTKMEEMEESLELVEKNLPEKFKKFVGMGLAKDGIYKRIEFCIQEVLDICAIINSDLKLGIPASEEDILDNLMKNKIASAELGEKVKQMKGFRNILVHRYGGINDKRAFESIKDGLKDFRQFVKEVEEILAKHSRAL